MLDEQELGDYIDSHFTRVLFRLETLDLYDVASNGEEYHRYVAGEVKPNPERKKPWMEHIRGEVARGLHTYRVHVVRSPLNDYLRFECEWGYVYNARAGEHIRILDLADRRLPGSLVHAGDYMVIDDNTVVRMHYTDGGAFVGAHVVNQDPAVFVALRDVMWDVAEPFTSWWARHTELQHARPVA